MIPSGEAPRVVDERVAVIPRLLRASVRVFAWATLITLGLLVALLVAIYLFVASNPLERISIYPDAARQLSLIVRTTFMGGPTVGPSSEVQLVADRLDRPIRIGNYGGYSWAGTDGFREGAINICELRYPTTDRRFPTLRAVSIIRSDGVRVTFRVTTDCPTGFFGAEPGNGPAS